MHAASMMCGLRSAVLHLRCCARARRKTFCAVKRSRLRYCALRRKHSLARSLPSMICARRRAIAAAWRKIFWRNFAKACRSRRRYKQPMVNPARIPDLIVRGKRVITPEGERPAAIHIRGGTISAVCDFADVPPGIPIQDAGNSAVMPGIVDTHVHINEPGRTEWEGFSTATRAAAAGGVTTLIEMPLNSIPARTNVPAYSEKLAAAQSKLWVDVGFWGGVVPGNIGELHSLWEAGVFGFKCFLVLSGVEEFEHVTESDLRSALPKLRALGAPLLAHAELPGPIENAVAMLSSVAPATAYSTCLASRPRQAENEAIELLLSLSR